MRFRQLLPLFGALFALYIIWGSTYFVIRIGVESWPPLMMAGVRFLAAGILLLAFLLLRGHKLMSVRMSQAVHDEMSKILPAFPYGQS